MASIIAVAAITHPIVVNEREVAVTLAFGFTTILLTYPTRKGFIWQKARYFAAVGLFLLSRCFHSTPTGRHAVRYRLGKSGALFILLWYSS